MSTIDVVAMLAVFQYLVFGSLVGKARRTYGVQPPAVVGHEMFERLYRVQMNTLELLVALLPALYVAGRYWPSCVVAGAGAVYLLGRVVYWHAYKKDPSKRSLGFLLSFLPIVGLALVGFAAAVLGKGAA